MEKCAPMLEEGYISMNPIIGNIITADKGGTAAQSDRNRARATACHSMPQQAVQCSGHHVQSNAMGGNNFNNIFQYI